VTPCIIHSGEFHDDSCAENSELSFSTESRDSLHCLIRRVATPRTVYSGESLLIPGSHFFKFEELPLPPIKETSKKKSTMPIEHCSLGKFLNAKNRGCPRLNFLLPAVIASGESIFRYFEHE
jgi:hypothetical protein